VTAEFWGAWKEFEVKHGNEDTMKEMLRVKRSVQALYNTQVLDPPFLPTSPGPTPPPGHHGGNVESEEKC